MATNDKVFDLYISEALLKEARLAATQQGRTLSSVIRDLLNDWLNSKPASNS